MEDTMNSINNIKLMEVIDINTGSKLGYIKDLKVNCDENRVESLILPSIKENWFSKREDLEVPWENIRKIGLDVILVDIDGLIIDNK